MGCSSYSRLWYKECPIVLFICLITYMAGWLGRHTYAVFTTSVVANLVCGMDRMPSNLEVGTERNDTRVE